MGRYPSQKEFRFPACLFSLEAPDSKDTATFLRRARAASLKAKGSRFGALAEGEYDKIAPVIACTLPALTDTITVNRKKERGARGRGDE